jgi:hypothetical protein
MNASANSKKVEEDEKIHNDGNKQEDSDEEERIFDKLRAKYPKVPLRLQAIKLHFGKASKVSFSTTREPPRTSLGALNT